jgi:hypothetical protein
VNESIYRWDSRDEVYVERDVAVWDVVDKWGCEDPEDGRWRKRTPQEFADAIVRATEGLTDLDVVAQENHGSGVVLVYGYRATTNAEKRDFDAQERRQWERARGTFLDGLLKWGVS